MAKTVTERRIKESPLGITKQIDINFRDYALYVLENRGIPSFYDGLTNVQRVSLMNAPKTFSKTISLVGACISNGYHHGDCLDYNTKIHLADGSFLSIGEWYEKCPDVELSLVSYDEKTDKLVHEIGHSPRIGQLADVIYDIEFADGSIETCTENHPWYTQRGWVETKDLRKDDDVLDKKKFQVRVLSITKRTLEVPVPMYDITVNRTSCFFVGNAGILSHNSSLQGAINKLTKPFGCGEQLLIGDGFFGSPVNTEASAARYTSVKINPVVNELLNKYMVLNKKNSDDQWEWLRTEMPIGLLTMVVGIAVGYKSTVLPRKTEEIIKYLDGNKKASLNPYFKGFNGKISPYNGLKKTWLIEGVTKVNNHEKSVQVLELPPLMKYDSFIKKLSKLADSTVDFVMQNDSSDNVDITLKYKGGCTWDEFVEKIDKMNKLIVSETIVFVKDGSVIEYTDIADYLTEYRVHREAVRLEKSIHDLQNYNEELEFLRAKMEYLKFMLSKKRTDTEIDVFLGAYISRIKTRLERTLLRDLSNDVMLKTQDLIKEMIKTIKNEECAKKSLEVSLEKLKVDTPVYSKHTSNTRSMDLFLGEEDEIDGISVFGTEQEKGEDEEILEKGVENE